MAKTTTKKKFLGINLTNEVKYLYLENCRTLKIEFGEEGKIQVNGSLYLVHGLSELTSLKCPHYPKQSIDSVQFLLKYQWHISQI